MRGNWIQHINSVQGNTMQAVLKWKAVCHTTSEKIGYTWKHSGLFNQKKKKIGLQEKSLKK